MKKTFGTTTTVQVFFVTAVLFALGGCGDGTEDDSETSDTDTTVANEPVSNAGGSTTTSGNSISPELAAVLSSPRGYWNEDFEYSWMEGCYSSASERAPTTRDAAQYCACALIVIEKLAPTPEGYVAKMSTFNSAFMDIGGAAYCTRQASEMALDGKDGIVESQEEEAVL